MAGEGTRVLNVVCAERRLVARLPGSHCASRGNVTGPLMGGPQIACQFQEMPMSHVSDSHLYPYRMSSLRNSPSHVTIFLSHVNKLNVNWRILLNSRVSLSNLGVRRQVRGWWMWEGKLVDGVGMNGVRSSWQGNRREVRYIRQASHVRVGGWVMGREI